MDINSLKTALPNIQIEANYPLAPYTSLRIGGPADIFIHTKSNEEFIKVLKLISEENNFSEHSERVTRSGQPEGSEHRKNLFSNVTILGNGSNVLISDQGIRGIVIKNSSSQIDILSTSSSDSSNKFQKSYTQRMENEPDKYLDFTKLDYDESNLPPSLVKISSGTPLPYAVNQLLESGLTGLQWFAYIPGTIGGAVWYNIHGGSYHFADYIDSVEVFDLKTSETRQLKSSELSWSYEKSYFQQNPHFIILSATLRLFHGDTNLAKQVRDAWVAQKVKVQPMNSAGSAFANPSLEDCQRIWGEQKSTGWIIDHELGWKGKTIGGAQISDKHANFIVNANHATSADYYKLLMEIQSEVLTRFKLKLIPEIRLLGDFS